jgi:hypothetical protein
MEEFDFEKDLSINKFRLDEECLSHSSIYFKYAEAQQNAKSEVSKADDVLKLTLAERELEIRNKYSENGIKVTENLIKADVEKDEDVLKAKRKLRKAQDIFNKLTVAVQALDSRRSELDNLVKLYCAGYFSMPNSNDKSRKDATEQTAREIRKNLNK